VSTDPLQTLLIEIRKVEKRRVKKALTWDAIGEEIQNALNGGTPPVEDDYVSGPPVPVIPPQFPKLLVNYGKTGLPEEWIVVNNFTEWNPIHHWFVRPMSELPALKEQGVRERLKEDWERRKEAGSRK